ncbi:hypothetical protein Nepgr_021083 [Nepenthes gracilis]|uniref:Uncharacterized protein n=1 Tax=Nepenthes gracilis TaxID=150966 RepID=A0AAD3XVM8_NEPGR|nr:hypothetical protein Nepgr_021083 [Nepenthes gracilis]
MAAWEDWFCLTEMAKAEMAAFFALILFSIFNASNQKLQLHGHRECWKPAKNQLPNSTQQHQHISQQELSPCRIQWTGSRAIAPIANFVSVPAEAEVGLKGVQFDDAGAYQCSDDVGGASHITLEDPDGAHQVMGNPSYVLDQLEGSPDEAHSAEDCLKYGVDDSTPGSIARLAHKYSLDDVPNKVNPRDSPVEGQLGEAQVAIQEDLISVPLTSCMAVEAKATVADPMHSLECCPINNSVQSHVVSDLAETDCGGVVACRGGMLLLIAADGRRGSDAVGQGIYRHLLSWLAVLL